jgi:hypothetical protein
MTEPDLSAPREQVENGDMDAVDELIELAGEQGNLDQLQRLTEQGNTTTADVLIELAGEQGNATAAEQLTDPQE